MIYWKQIESLNINMGVSNTKKFIEKSIIIHGDRYNYDYVDYKKAIDKVIIECSIHGTFSITPNSHLNGSGCYFCGREKVESARKLTNKDFIERAVLIHGDLYDYSRVEYKSYMDYVEIGCKKHGVFKQKVSKHLDGQSCKKCISESNYVDFISICKDKFEGYSYDKVDYKGMYNDVIITCDKHGDFKTKPVSFLHKERGCKKCVNRTKSKPETEWLDDLNIDVSKRNVYIRVGEKTLCVDAYDEEKNIIYEFYGDYFHGNPEKFDHSVINKRMGKTYGELYNKTIEREKSLIDNGYKVISIWESDFINNKKKVKL